MSTQPVPEKPVSYPIRGSRGVFSAIVDRIAMFVATFNFKSFIFSCVMIPLMSLVYLTVIADGWRIAFEGMANKKLYKTEVAVLTGIDQYEFAHRLDIASCCAIVMMVLVWMAGTKTLRLLLCNKGYKKGVLNLGLFRRVILTITIALFTLDSYLFYNGIAESSWGAGGGLKAIVATLGWASALFGLCFFHVTLKMDDSE